MSTSRLPLQKAVGSLGRTPRMTESACCHRQREELLGASNYTYAETTRTQTTAPMRRAPVADAELDAEQ